MRKSKFTEYQIVRIIKSVEGGRTVKDVCRENGICNGTYYKWKSKYGGMEASHLEDEGSRSQKSQTQADVR